MKNNSFIILIAAVLSGNLMARSVLWNPYGMMPVDGPIAHLVDVELQEDGIDDLRVIAEDVALNVIDDDANLEAISEDVALKVLDDTQPVESSDTDECCDLEECCDSESTSSEPMRNSDEENVAQPNDNNNDLDAKYKTELCKNYIQHGECKYGSNCRFAHGAEQLRLVHPCYKKSLCKNFVRYKFCRYGSRCHFAHGQNELRKD